jgi:hypothetical protein
MAAEVEKVIYDNNKTQRWTDGLTHPPQEMVVKRSKQRDFDSNK